MYVIIHALMHTFTLAYTHAYIQAYWCMHIDMLMEAYGSFQGEYFPHFELALRIQFLSCHISRDER